MRSSVGRLEHKLLTTGQAAELCSVTTDTVYKWIRAGKISARRTPGGHHRIDPRILIPYLKGGFYDIRPDSSRGIFQYCWEFNSESDVIPEGCKQCVVYRSGTRRCYEMSKLPKGSGYVGQFCDGSCEDCEYYKLVRGQPLNVLVVTDQNKLRNSLARVRRDKDLNLEVTDCEYRCSMLIDRFRPDYVVIDCSLGVERSREFARLLSEDPRIPLARVVLAGDRGDLPKECDKLVFALVQRQLSAETLAELVSRIHMNL